MNNTVSGESSLNFCLEILGELDDQLAPIGKELFSMEEDDNSEWDDEDLMGEARPGTTKRKQYYLKKVSNGMSEASPGTTKRKQYYLKKVSVLCTFLIIILIYCCLL